MARRLGEHEVDELLDVVHLNPALFREVHRRVVRAGRVGQKHVAPSAAREHVLDVNHVVGEFVEEDARLHVVLDPFLDEAERDRPERLVRVGQRDHHLVGRRDRAERGEEGNRAEEAHQAHAARLHRHELAIGGEASQADENPEEHGDRNRQAQRLRQERQQNPRNDRPLHAARNQRLGLLENWRDLEDERERHQADRKGERDLAHEVAIKDSQQALLSVRPFLNSTVPQFHRSLVPPFSFDRLHP